MARDTVRTRYSAHLAASDDFMAEAEASNEVYLAIGERMSSGRVVGHTCIWMTWQQASDLCSEMAKALALHGAIHPFGDAAADVTAAPNGTCTLADETGVPGGDVTYELTDPPEADAEPATSEVGAAADHPWRGDVVVTGESNRIVREAV